MSFIETIPPSEAGEPLRSLYDKVKDPGSGEVDHIMAVHSLHPAGLAAHFELYRAVMRGSRGLPTVDRELIALTVSQANACHY